MSAFNTQKSDPKFYDAAYFNFFLKNNDLQDTNVFKKFETDILNPSKIQLTSSEFTNILDNAVSLLESTKSPQIEKIKNIAIEMDLIYNEDTHHFENISFDKFFKQFIIENNNQLTSIKPIYEKILELRSAKTDDEKYAALKKTIFHANEYIIKDPKLLIDLMSEINLSEKYAFKLIEHFLKGNTYISDKVTQKNRPNYDFEVIQLTMKIMENELNKNKNFFEFENGELEFLVRQPNHKYNFSFILKFILKDDFIAKKYHDIIQNTCYKILVSTWEDYPFSQKLDYRVELAEAMLQNDPDYLAESIALLFTEKEILQTQKIQTLIRNLEPKIISKNTRDYFNLTKMYLELCKTDDGGEKDNPVLRCIGKEETKTGTNWFFRLATHYNHPTIYRDELRATNRENLDAANFLLFPAVSATDISFTCEAFPWAKILGFQQYDGLSGRFIRLPEPDAIEQRWKDLTDSYPEIATKFKPPLGVPVPGTATAEQYNEGIRKGGIIYSTTHEFSHDIIVHYLSTLEVLFSDPEKFERMQERFIRVHKESDPIIAAARETHTSSREVDLLSILELSAGIFADLFTASFNLDLRERFVRDWGSGELIQVLWKSDNWRRSYPEIIKDYTAEEITDFWLKIQSEYKAPKTDVQLRARL